MITGSAMPVYRVSASANNALRIKTALSPGELPFTH